MKEPVLKAPAPRPHNRCERCGRNQKEHTCEWCNMEICEECIGEHERECGERV